MPKPLGTYALINSTTLGSAQATVTFDNIPATYTDLIMTVSGVSSSSFTWIIARFNSDTGTNYSYTLLQGDGATASSTRASNNASPYVGLVNSGTGSLNMYKFQINDYSNTTTNKTLITNGGLASNRVQAGVMLWRSTAAINRIDLTLDGGDTFASGARFRLFGLTAGNQ